MKGYTHIDSIILTQANLEKAFKLLRYAGSKGVEGICLFAGKINDTTFIVEETIIPSQKSYILEQGLMYSVDSEELHRLNIWLYQNEMQLIAQIHSHPGEAYHSLADDRYPIVDAFGGISIVVPYFAVGEVSLLNTAVYRLSLNRTWDKLSIEEVKSLFKLE
jgi:hypothetical protein